jgi:hypothetical protein
MRSAVLTIVWVCFFSFELVAQSFEVSGVQENYRGFIGDVVKAPLTLKNNTSKPINVVLKRISSQLGSTQKSFLSIAGNHLDSQVEDIIVRLEPGQTLSNVAINLEAGLVPGFSTTKFVLFNKSNPTDSYSLDLAFLIEEKGERTNIFQSPSIIVYDIYPNPISDHAYVQYQILRERVSAKIVIHNVLGNPLSQYELPAHDTQVKMAAESFNPGIYFYTLYLENEAVMTRKLIVKK